MGKNGRGSFISISKRHQINTKISIEADIIGVENVMTHMLWTKYFL